MRLSIIILFSLYNTFINAQEEGRMFLLTSYLEDRFHTRFYGCENIFCNSYPNILYTIEADTLVAIDSLGTSEEYMASELKQFPDQDLIFIDEKHIKNYYPFVYSFLDYSGDSLVVRKYNAKENDGYENAYYLWRYFLLINDNMYVHFSYKKNPTRFLATDRHFNSKAILLEDYESLHMTGSPSPYIYSPIFSHYRYPFKYIKSLENYKWTEDLKIQAKNAGEETLKLMIGMTVEMLDIMPESKIQIPSSLRDSTIFQMNIHLVDKNYVLARGESRILDNEGRPIEYYWLYDKNKGSLDTLKFNREYKYSMAIAGEWIYGTLTDPSKEYIHLDRLETSLSSVSEQEKYFEKNNRLTAGRYSSRYGYPPNLMDKTGELYLLHIPTRKRIHWNSGERDSEILLMKGSRIYYRKYDEIRSVDIDEERIEVEWETDRLHVKDPEVVPFVHMIFLSQTKQESCKVEWVDTMD